MCHWKKIIRTVFIHLSLTIMYPIFIFPSVVFEFSQAPEILHGDVNMDGKVDIRDAVLLSKAASGMVTLNDLAATNADCNADGELGIDDVMVLIRFLVHYINVLPSTE